MTAATAAAASFFVFIAFFARGVSGFGSATVAIPLMVHFVPLQILVPLFLIHDFLSTLATVTIDRRAVDKGEIRILLPFTVIGSILGVTLLVSLPAAPLLTLLGVLVIVFGIRMLVAPQGHRLVSRFWAIPAGLTGGALGGAFGTGAATPSMIYLTHRLSDKARVRGTFSGFAILDYSFRLIVFAAAGLLLDYELLLMVMVTLPAMALGLYAGNRLHGRISHEQALRVISFLLIASGTSLVWKALA